MKDKKNIVIKVRYPTSGKKGVYDVSSASKVRTEWNIKRILMALLGVVLIMVVLFFFLKHDTQKTDLQPKAVLQPKSALPEKIVNTPVKPKIESNKNIIRALLTSKINHNEPVDEIIPPLKLSKKKSTIVYYFVELTAMNGRRVYHEWLLDGKIITRKGVNISNNTWRTSSRQLFTYSVRTNWTARLVDETGQLLNQINFNVIYE